MAVAVQKHIFKAFNVADEFIVLPVALNDAEIIVATLYCDDENQSGIYKYNVHENEWYLVWKYPDDVRQSVVETEQLSINEEKTIIFLRSTDQVIKLNLVNNTHKIIHTENLSDFGKDIVINNEFHTFGTWNHRDHLILNENKGKYIEHFEFTEYHNRMIRYSLLYAKKRGILLIIGGKDEKQHKDCMYIYDVNSKQTKQLSVRLPYPMAYMNFLLTNDEKYGIIIGGETKDEEFMETITDIHILDLDTMCWRTSNVKYDGDTMVDAVIVGNAKRANLITHGFIRQCWSMNAFTDILYPSDDLIKLMSEFYHTDMIHVFNDDTYGSHYAIRVDEILR